MRYLHSCSIAAIVMGAVLFGGSASSESISSSLESAEFKDLDTVSVAKLPEQVFVNQAVEVHVGVSGSESDFEYRYMIKDGDEDWNFGAAWSESPKFSFVSSKPGVLAFHVQVRRKGNGKLVLDKWVGQVVVYDRRIMLDLVSAPLSQLHTYIVPGISASFRAEDTSWRGGIKSFKDLYLYVERDFERYDFKKEEKQFEHEDVMRGIYYMAFVSGLWAYGNKNNPNLPGCSTGNEVSGPIPSSSVTVKTFLETPIGCCTDYATVLALLLTSRGIENRIVEVFDDPRSSSPSHVFNEALLGGRWWTLDANINVAYAGNWEEVIDQRRQVDAFLIPHSNMSYESLNYRASVGSFRTFMLTAASNGYFSKSEHFRVEDWMRRQGYGEPVLEVFRK